MVPIGKTLVMVGLGIAVLGGVAWAIGTVFPDFKPGRLPGDIAVEGERGGFYFPITTMILVSVVLTVILWLVGLVRR